MRRYVCFFSLLFSPWIFFHSYCPADVVFKEYQAPVQIPQFNEGIPFTIPVEDAGIIAEVTVHLKISHPNLLQLHIQLQHRTAIGTERTVVLFDGDQSKIPIGATGIDAVYDDPDSPLGSLSRFTGMDAQGDWTLLVTDKGDGSLGTLEQFALEIERASLGLLAISQNNRSVKVLVDGYGSFGDQVVGNLMGAEYQPLFGVDGKNTIFSSALILHSTETKINQFLTSLDNLPGNRLPSVPLVEIDDSLVSWFRIDGIEVRLIQKLIQEEESNFIWLIQDYLFEDRSPSPGMYLLTRYINPQFRIALKRDQDPLGKLNYFFMRNLEGRLPEFFLIDRLSSNRVEQSPLVRIDFRSDLNEVPFYDFAVDEWLIQTQKQFDQRLVEESTSIYDAVASATDWNDFDGDGFTDINKPFDVALAHGVSLDFRKKRKLRYIALTQWAYASPEQIMSSTEHLDTDFFIHEIPGIAPTPTQTPIPTSTPTPTATPTPTFSPTQTPFPPRWLKPLPDIRLIEGQEANKILDFSQFIYDPDTPLEDLEFSWTITGNQNLNLKIEESNRFLSAHPIARDLTEVTLYVQDRSGQNFIQQSFWVKVSSFLTQSFRPMAPIILAQGEQLYTSPFSLDEFIVEKESFASGSLTWFVYKPLPVGIESVVIHDDHSFTVKTDQQWQGGQVEIPFIVRRNKIPTTPVLPTPTPTQTPSFTSTPVVIPTKTNTPSHTPTFTATPLLPTFTSTNTPALPTVTPTATSTPVPVPTATQIPTLSPTATIPPASTPTPLGPTATPIERCTDAFAFSRGKQSGSLVGPLDWLAVPGNESRIVLSHYDEGVLGFYAFMDGKFRLQSSLQEEFGVSNLAWGAWNDDNLLDLYVLNAAQEAVTVYQGVQPNSFQKRDTLDLSEEQIPDLFDIENGIRFQALLVGNINHDGVSDAVIRARHALLIAPVVEGQWTITQKIEVEGITRFVKGTDLDRDGDLDIVLAVQTNTGEEHVWIYRNQEGTFVRSQSLRTDVQVNGNNPLDIILRDWNHDNIPDLQVIVFSGEVQRYQGIGDGTFTLTHKDSPFPPGEIVAFDVIDFDQNGSFDLAVLLRNQQGLSFVVACGEESYETLQFLVSNLAPNGDKHVLHGIDIDGDGDQDVVFTRNFLDDILWIENRIQSPDHSNE